MDPNEALRRIRELLVDEGADVDLWIELIELVQGLDSWLSKGGFLPEAWDKDTAMRKFQRDMWPDRDPLGPPNPAHGELPDPGHCLDCLQPRNSHADRHCRATSTRWDRTYHRWSNDGEDGQDPSEKLRNMRITSEYTLREDRFRTE